MNRARIAQESRKHIIEDKPYLIHLNQLLLYSDSNQYYNYTLYLLNWVNDLFLKHAPIHELKLLPIYPYSQTDRY